MNRKMKPLVVLALIALTMTLVTCKPIDYYLQRVYKAYGRVTDANTGQPLESVEVFIKGYQYSELTNSLGDYEIELAEGRWTLEFVKDGYLTVESDPFTVGPTNQRELVDAQLMPTAPMKQDGTLTVVLTTADAIDGKDVLGGLFDAGANPASDPLLAGVDFTVSSGSGSGTMVIMEPPYSIWVGTGGSSYDVYLWVDMNGNRGTVQYPESGVDMQLSTFPFTVEIDGDITVTYTGADFVTVP